MNLDLKKLARQQQWIKTWTSKGARGVLEAVTGFGKSYCGVLAIQRLRDFPQYNTLIVVPSTYLYDQWTEHIKTYDLQNCIVMTIQSIIIMKTLPTASFVICDEQQEFFGKQYSKVFDIPCLWYKGLSGTLTDEMKIELRRRKVPVLDTITVEEALENGWISDFRVYNLGIPLSFSDTYYLKEIEEDYYKNMAIFKDYPEVLKMFKKTGTRKVKNKQGEIIEIAVFGFAEERAKEIGVTCGEVLGKAKTIRKIIAERQKFFYDHPFKIQVVKEILEHIPDKLAITFSLSIDLINKLEDENSVVYHSKQKKKEQKKALQKFTELGDKCRCIHSGKALVRGADFKNLALGIRVSYNSSKISWGQSRGRQLRKEGDKFSTIVNLYMKRLGRPTIEEVWLRKSLDGSDLNVFWIDDVSQIKI